MSNFSSLLNAAGFQVREAAAGAAIARTESAFGVHLPDDFRAFWALSDGAAGDGIDILPLAAVDAYAAILTGGFRYVPFTDCNDSNPYAICCLGPLRGMVVHLFHDDEAHLICRGLTRFLELVAEARQGDGDVDRIAGDFAFDRPDRSAADAVTAQELMLTAEGLGSGDASCSDTLRFAAQLVGPGREKILETVSALGDEYVRRTVRQRLNGLATPEARELLRADTAAYTDFLATLERAFKAAAVKTEPLKQGEFRLQPGNVGLNFAMLFADRRRPGAIDEWVQRFKARIAARQT